MPCLGTAACIGREHRDNCEGFVGQVPWKYNHDAREDVLYTVWSAPDHMNLVLGCTFRAWVRNRLLGTTVLVQGDASNRGERRETDQEGPVDPTKHSCNTFAGGREELDADHDSDIASIIVIRGSRLHPQQVEEIHVCNLSYIGC